jgi:cytochrome c-type biogenesis protein CcmH
VTHLRRFLLLLGLLMAALMPLPAAAVEPREMLQDPVLEARARDISKHLRCLVCQNQSIDDSDADLAHDLRVLVRERLEQGDSNQQVIDYITARYGDFVLLKPPFEPATWLLWFGPAAILLLGVAGIVAIRRRRAAAPQPELSAEERRRLADLLKDRE